AWPRPALLDRPLRTERDAAAPRRPLSCSRARKRCAGRGHALGGRRARGRRAAGRHIVAFDGEPVGTVDELHRMLTEEKVGRPAQVALLRRAEKLLLDVTPRE